MAVGPLCVGIGMFLALSLATFSARDLSAAVQVTNWGGLAGARIGAVVIPYVGAVGYVWALALVLLGVVLLVRRRLWRKKVRSALVLLLFTPLLCGWAEIAFSGNGPASYPNGPGGMLGIEVATLQLRHIGLGGSVVLLVLIAFGSFAALALVDTPEPVRRLKDLSQRFRLRSTAGELPRELPNAAAGPAGSASDASAPGGAASEGDRGGGVLDQDLVQPLSFDFAAGGRNKKPPAKLFKRSDASPAAGLDLEGSSQTLLATLADFKVTGEITACTAGPVVTTYELSPSAGIKASKVAALGTDLARVLKTDTLRVIAPMPGKDTIGFEVPNEERRVIRFGNLLSKLTAGARSMVLPIIMGVDTLGKPVIADLAEMPHLLVAGATGSGKSVFINTLISSLVCKRTTRELRFVMIDPKMVELAPYDRLPHMACPVVTDMQNHGLAVLRSLVAEMERRYSHFGAVKAKNLQGFNQVTRTKRKGDFPGYEGKWSALPYVVVVIDEYADMAAVLGKDAESLLARVAQKARAAGIHLVVATQRPSVQIITGSIKANFTTRVAFRVQSMVDSRTILDHNGAESLLGQGDMLFESARGCQRVHGAYLGEDEVERMVAACRR
jgi:S-DNA-T family DNA segregation ATPase FtsK/SpoIIIE